MKFIKWILGIITAISVIIVLLISSVELAVYGDYGYFEREYTKYSVLEDVNMEMDDLMYVTKEMMRYLRGNRDTLIVETIVGGEPAEFFNEKEIKHMEDCRILFIGAIWLRRICIGLIILCAAGLILLKQQWKQIICRSIKITAATLAGLTVLLALIISANFSSAFTKFHEIFFDNDLWLLDPRTDRLINILPEGFFVDTAIRIGVIFAVSMLIILVVTFVVDYGILKKQMDQ